MRFGVKEELIANQENAKILSVTQTNVNGLNETEVGLLSRLCRIPCGKPLPYRNWRSICERYATGEFNWGVRLMQIATAMSDQQGDRMIQHRLNHSKAFAYGFW